MSKSYYVIIAVLLLSAAYVGGYWTGSGNVTTVEKRVEVEGKTQIVYRDRIVTHTVVVAPDGTRTESDKTEEVAQDTSNETNSSSDDKSTTPQLASYSIGARYHLQPLSFADTLANPYRGLEITAGRRILGEVWVDLGVQPLNKDVSLGVRIDL